MTPELQSDAQITVLTHTNSPAPYAALANPGDLADPARLAAATVWMDHTTIRALAIRLGADPGLWPQDMVILPDATTFTRDTDSGLYPVHGLHWHLWEPTAASPAEPRTTYAQGVADRLAAPRARLRRQGPGPARQAYWSGHRAAAELLLVLDHLRYEDDDEEQDAHETCWGIHRGADGEHQTCDARPI
ncbi:hypothetical protein [Kitasatospora azatica]|uniref:hypothetical protein n=1 Tax=Kitasatospora azatica TaxID=58347 RepID=UPI00055ED7EC|nr:hypothetical protein [Kitasatospora azatica]